MSKAKYNPNLHYIKIDMDIYYLILDNLPKAKTIKHLLDEFKLISRPFLYLRMRELKRKGFIEEIGRNNYKRKIKNKFQGKYYHLTERGKNLLILKQFVYRKKEIITPLELEYAIL